jgi:phage gpG-like protein
MTIQITQTGASEVRTRLSEMAGNIRTQLRTAIDASCRDMEDQVRAKLDGPVLAHRTGRLLDSANTKFLEDTETRIVGSVGVNTPYAAIHEYGFQGVVNVREHLRTITQAFGKPIAPREIAVRAHPMSMNLPERSYLRSTLAANAPAIADRLRAAVDEAVAT